MTCNFSTQQEIRSANEHGGFLTDAMGDVTRSQFEIRRIAKAAMGPYLGPESLNL